MKFQQDEEMPQPATAMGGFLQAPVQHGWPDFQTLLNLYLPRHPEACYSPNHYANLSKRNLILRQNLRKCPKWKREQEPELAIVPSDHFCTGARKEPKTQVSVTPMAKVVLLDVAQSEY